MFTVIEHGELYAPEPLGQQSLLLIDERIGHIGLVDSVGLQRLGLPCQIIDADGCLVLPGFVDPHEHLLGAGGEQGFASRMPELLLPDLVRGGVTTAVGCLGTDVTTRSLPALLGKVRQLTAQGLSAWMYTGGFRVPPSTISGSVQDDLVLIEQVVGLGELAISDRRSSIPTIAELARLVSETAVGGSLSGKAGITHFHVGPGHERLSPLMALLDRFDVAPEVIYPTHVNRDEALLAEGVVLAARGCFVDFDTVDGDLGHWLRLFLSRGGRADRLTVSSDAHTPDGRPAKLYACFQASIRDEHLPLEQVLPCFTANPAQALKLLAKGRLGAGFDADLLVVERESLRLIHVFARGRQLMRDGEPVGLIDQAR